MRLLLAEDERELSRALVAILAHDHYSVDAVYDGEDALDYGLSGQYDGMILDIMMPKRDGLSVLRALRAEGVTTPVLLLTARSEVEDRISGLDSGADDYLPKPFAMGELLARIRAMVRRGNAYSPDLLRLGNIALNRSTFELTGPQGRFTLGNKEFQLLEMLLRNPRQLIPAERFMERVWGCDAEAEINVVWVYLSYIRKKLTAVGANVGIKAVRGAGYRLEEYHD